jgi:hypothetical protein
MNDYFEILKNFMGVGEPNEGIWFVGIEEAYQWKENVDEDKDKYLKYKERVFCQCPGELENDANSYGIYYTKIYQIMSKIVVGIKKIDPSEPDNWKVYQNRFLMQKGSGVFQTNIYPLGKKKVGDWPKYYKKLFGYGAENTKEYESVVRKERFPLIRSFWRKSNPPLTICFGIESWGDFESLFEIEGEKYTEENGIRIYADKRIMLTPFFDNRKIPNAMISRIAGIARRLIIGVDLDVIDEIPSGKYNRWGERRLLVCSDTEKCQAVCNRIAQEPCTTYEKSALLVHELCGCKGLEFVAFSNLCFEKPVVFNNKIILFPCFSSVKPQNVADFEQVPSDTLKMKFQARYVYDGWIPILDWIDRSVRSAIREVTEALAVLSLYGRTYFDWEPKYIFLDRSIRSSYFLNSGHVFELETISRFVESLPERDLNAIMKSFGWISESVELDNVLARFLFNILAIENLAYYIEKKCDDGSPFHALRSVDLSRAEKKRIREECIHNTLGKILESNPTEAIERAYFDCVHGIASTVKAHLREVFGNDKEPVDLLFNMKVRGCSLYDLRNRIAHGRFDLISEEQKEIVNSRLWDVERIAKRYIMRVIELTFTRSFDENNQVLACQTVSLLHAIVSHEKMNVGPKKMSEIYT